MRQRYTNDSVWLDELSTLVENLENSEDWRVLNDSVLIWSRKKTEDKTIKERSFFFFLYANAINNKGLYMREMGKTDSALYYYKFAADIARKNNRRDQLAGTINNIAFVYSKKGDYKAALNYYFEALRIFTELNIYKDVARAKNNIGYIYYEEGEIDLAYKYFKESAEEVKKLGDMKAYCSSVINYSGILKHKGDTATARKNITELIPISKELNDQKIQSFIYFNLASLWFDQNLDSALKFYKQALELRQKINNQPGIISCKSRIGNIYYLQGKKAEAKKILTHTFNLAIATGYVSEQREIAKSLWQIFKDEGDAKQSLKFYEHYILINDSMRQQQSKKEGIRKMFQYEFNKKAAADSVKYAEQKKITEARITAQKAEFKQEKFQKYAVIIGIFVVLGGLMLVFNRFRIINKQKKIIEQQKVLVDNAYHSLAEKNKEVMDSIRYAKRIQSALVTSESYIERKLNSLNNKNNSSH